jgi:hypothetical protein
LSLRIPAAASTSGSEAHCERLGFFVDGDRALPDINRLFAEWYYRANRVDHSRCWFLSSSNVSAHSRLRQTASVTRGHFVRPKTGEVPEAQQDRQYGPQIASAIGPAEDRLASGHTMVPEVSTRAQDPLRSYELACAQSRHDPLQTRGAGDGRRSKRAFIALVDSSMAPGG